MFFLLLKQMEVIDKIAKIRLTFPGKKHNNF
jgi:hypothetical protein